MAEFYAHSTESPDKADWQTLEEHLRGVAERAEEFAAAFGAGEWGRLAGENHDLGKGTFPWQAYLRFANKIVDEFSKYYAGHPAHAAVGAQWFLSIPKRRGNCWLTVLPGIMVDFQTGRSLRVPD